MEVTSQFIKFYVIDNCLEICYNKLYKHTLFLKKIPSKVTKKRHFKSKDELIIHS